MHEYGHHHDHAHDHCHDEVKAQTCGHDCDHCTGDPKEELKALMNYMVKHNKSHCAELEALAKQLQQLGDNTGYEQVMLAVSDFEKGNMRLSTVLAAMNEG